MYTIVGPLPSIDVAITEGYLTLTLFLVLLPIALVNVSVQVEHLALSVFLAHL